MEKKNYEDPFTPINEGELIDPFVRKGDNSDGVKIITHNDRANVAGETIFARVGNAIIHAPLDCSITINEYNSEVFVDHYKLLTPPNDRQYIILFYSVEEDDEMNQHFEIVQGRQIAYEYIRAAVDDCMDLKKSMIMAETVELRKAISCLDFVKMCIDDNLVEEDESWIESILEEYEGE